MIHFRFLLFFFFAMVDLQEASKTGRHKRYLVYPKPGSKVQFIVGTGVPIPLENHAITMGWVVKSMYLLPTNASEYTDSYVTFQKRSIAEKPSRYDFYRSIENAAQRCCWMNMAGKCLEYPPTSFGAGGKECMLRTICEVSRIPFKASGLVGQILKIFFMPSSTDEVPIIRSDIDYHNAETLGKEKDIDCSSIYPSCPFTLVDFLTIIS